MRRPHLWRSGLTALTVAVLGIGTLFATTMPAAAVTTVVSAETSASATEFTGYTDKDDLSTTGTEIVASG
ncbi:MAG: hypothetical protein QM604_10165 [Microbacterium sp.]